MGGLCDEKDDVMPFEKLVVRLLHGVHLVARPLTMGVRGAVFDVDGRIFLVRHTYVSGWYLPGGGVDPGETVAEALKREFVEEANIALLDDPILRSVHFQRHARAARPRPVLSLWRLPTNGAEEARRRDRRDRLVFRSDALPEDTTAATRRRLLELAGGFAIDPYW